MVTRKQFTATLETETPDSQNTFVVIPFDVEQTFGTRARVPVRGTINGFPFRTSISPYGGKHYLPVNKALRAGTNAASGDSVDIVMERDDKPRVVRPPADLARALKANPAAQARWRQLSYTHRKEYTRAVEEAKKPETRLRRIRKTIADLVSDK